MQTYIPFRQVFYICRFHDEEHINEDHTLQCLHPSNLTGNHCSSNCIARKTLETIAMQWDGKVLEQKELGKIESFLTSDSQEGYNT